MERFGSEIFERPETILSLKVLRNMEFVDGYFDYLRNNGTLDNVLRWTTKDTADFLSSNQEEQFENMSSHKNSLIFFSYNNALFISRLFQHEITMYHRPSWLKEELEQTLKRASMAGHIDVIETLFAYGAAAHMNFGASFKDEITGSYNVHARPLRDSREDKFIVEDLTLVRSLVGDTMPLVNRSLSSTRIDENLKVHLQNLRKFRNWSAEKKTKVMVAACEYGEVKIVQYLMQNSVSIPKNALSLCVLSKDQGYELFEYLLTVENWNEEQKVEALDTSCKVGALRHVQYLMKEGMSLTFDNLLSSVGADDNYDLIALVHGSQTWTRKQTEDATCLASFHGNVEVMRYFAGFLEETRDGFSDRCLILAALSPKPVPVFSILCQSQTSWSDKAVTEAMEIACAKLDMLLVECIVMNFKGSFGPRVLTIATKQSGEQESGIELIRFLMKEYHWDTKQKSMALSSAADQLNIPVARLLLQEGAQYQYKIC
ncbi:hypothetical protein FSP39_007279 [Pinctada imbricata]|uniref:Uncharacterized protein n=1 Tax=Pinctada imbricata TaxID=66713 RepID=A0AA88Y593_PINIB|nr:hypothetical protein FSP39_007279 [Pinctada imbricata]